MSNKNLQENQEIVSMLEDLANSKNLEIAKDYGEIIGILREKHAKLNKKTMAV